MDLYIEYLDGEANVFEDVTDVYPDTQLEEFIRVEMNDFSYALIQRGYVRELYTVTDADDFDDEDDGVEVID